MLHRDIDGFTDRHPATREAKEIFRPAYRLYSGALMDVIYDHYLATDPSVFNESSLRQFTHGTYEVLERHSAVLPAKFLYMLTYMKAEDWLFNYRYTEGIRKSLAGLVRRAAYLSESHTAFDLFTGNYVYLQSCYQSFFSDVKEFAKQRFELAG